MIRALPPSTTGQPTACAVIRNSRPKALVSGAVSGSMACAAAPASSARASVAAEPPGQHAGGQQALQAEPGHGQRVPRGPTAAAPRIVGRMSGMSRTSGPISRR